MERIWLLLDASCWIKHVERISLGPQAKGGKVHFGQDGYHKGKWFYYDAEEVLIIEFACSRKVSPKRHALQHSKTVEDEFVLLPAEHPIYTGPFWDERSIVHKNRDTVVSKKIDTKRIVQSVQS